MRGFLPASLANGPRLCYNDKNILTAAPGRDFPLNMAAGEGFRL